MKKFAKMKKKKFSYFIIIVFILNVWKLFTEKFRLSSMQYFLIFY